MSTTTTKEDKPSMLDDLKAQAAAIAAKIKEATDSHLATLHEKLGDAHKLVQSLTAEIEKHSGKPTVSAKRGRKAGKVKAAKPAKAGKKGKGKRGALGAEISKFLSGKGKTGAHVKDIAAAVGTKTANITAWLYSTGKSKVKKVKPATFALK